MDNINKYKVCVWGGGWAGMTAALELSEAKNCEVHLYEASDQWGGKVTGTRQEDGTFSTHAIRLISDYYPAFADICSRVPNKRGGTLLDHWSPVEFFNFSALRTKNRIHKVSRRVDKKLIGSLQLYWALRWTFGLKFRDILHIYKAIRRFRKLTEEEIEKLDIEGKSVEQYLNVEKMSDKGAAFLFTYLGITVAARPTSTASMSMDLMSKMFVGVKRSKHLTTEKYKNFRSWVIDGPMGDRLIPAFVEELKRRGVILHINSPLVGFENQNEGKTPLAYLKNGEKIEASAHLLALNNKVIEKLGFGRPEKELENEWSIGFSFPLKKIPKNFAHLDHKSITAVMDSPWSLVFVIWYRQEDDGLWSNEIDFSGIANQHMEIVASRLEALGTNGKTFFECTPQEAVKEILTQIDIDEDMIPDLVEKVRLSDNLEYVKEENQDGPYLYGDKQKDHDDYRWRLFAPIYTVSDDSQPLGIETKEPGVYLCGEAVKAPYPYIKTPTLELTTETSKAAVQKVADKLGLSLKVNQDYPERFAR